MEEKYRLYDEILAKLLQNIQVEDSQDEGIYINGYTNSPIGNTYMKMAEAYADIMDKRIVMLMSLFSYLRFIFSHWKVRKRYKWTIDFRWLCEIVTPLEDIANFVADYYNQTADVYEDIYKEFYN